MTVEFTICLLTKRNDTEEKREHKDGGKTFQHLDSRPPSNADCDQRSDGTGPITNQQSEIFIKRHHGQYQYIIVYMQTHVRLAKKLMLVLNTRIFL